MNQDPNLTPDGRIPMGDVTKLKENHPTLFLPSGAAHKPATPAAQLDPTQIFQQSLHGVSWHRDEDATDTGAKPQYFPALKIPGISEKFGVSRAVKEFYPGERDMFLQAFMNDVSEYLFQVSATEELLQDDGGVEFRPHPGYMALPVAKP